MCKRRALLLPRRPCWHPPPTWLCAALHWLGPNLCLPLVALHSAWRRRKHGWPPGPGGKKKEHGQGYDAGEPQEAFTEVGLCACKWQSVRVLSLVAYNDLRRQSTVSAVERISAKNHVCVKLKFVKQVPSKLPGLPARLARGRTHLGLRARFAMSCGFSLFT